MRQLFVGLGFGLIVGLGFTAPAESQNLLQNATFDGGITPWVSGTYSALDALASESSGSIQRTNSAPTPFTYESVVSECVPVVAGKSYATEYDYRATPSIGVAGGTTTEVGWYSGSNCSTSISFRGAASGNQLDGTWHSSSGSPLLAPATAQSANLRLLVSKNEAGGSVSANFDNVVFKPAGTCAALPDVICLNNSRFQVEANWQTATALGRARAVKMTNDTGYLWFFGPDNVEVVIKVLDACSFSGKYWVFAGGLTNQRVELTVTDMKTGSVWSKVNDLGVPFAPVQDTSAFATCP